MHARDCDRELSTSTVKPSADFYLQSHYNNIVLTADGRLITNDVFRAVALPCFDTQDEH